MNDNLCRKYAHWLRFWHRNSPIYELTLLMAKIFPHPRRCHAEFAGFSMALDLTDILQANLLVEESWEEDLAPWMEFVSSSARTLFDIGTHCGYFTLMMRARAGAQASLYGFEPNPRMQAQYRDNLALNKIDNVELVPAAVSSEKGSLTFNIRDDLEPGASSRYAVPYARNAVTVDTIVLDDFCDERGIEKVDVVKMDIEGGEASAIEGMRRGLKAGRYRSLLIEVHPDHLPPGGAESMINAFAAGGYLAYILRGATANPVSLDDALRGHDRIMVVHPDYLRELVLSLGVSDDAAPLHLPSWV